MEVDTSCNREELLCSCSGQDSWFWTPPLWLIFRSQWHDVEKSIWRPGWPLRGFLLSMALSPHMRPSGWLPTQRVAVGGLASSGCQWEVPVWTPSPPTLSCVSRQINRFIENHHCLCQSCFACEGLWRGLPNWGFSSPSPFKCRIPLSFVQMCSSFIPSLEC